MTASNRALVIMLASVLAGCDSIRMPPLAIEADGESYVACNDTVWISNEGGWAGETTFKVTFTDANGLEHLIKGIKKLSVTGGFPKRVRVPTTYLTEPSSTGLDSNGVKYVEGQVYYWADGTQAYYRNGKWADATRPFTGANCTTN